MCTILLAVGWGTETRGVGKEGKLVKAANVCQRWQRGMFYIE